MSASNRICSTLRLGKPASGPGTPGSDPDTPRATSSSGRASFCGCYAFCSAGRFLVKGAQSADKTAQGTLSRQPVTACIPQSIAICQHQFHEKKVLWNILPMRSGFMSYDGRMAWPSDCRLTQPKKAGGQDNLIIELLSLHMPWCQYQMVASTHAHTM